MQNKYLRFLLIALIIAFVIPQITLASWYNPFSWHVWDNFWNYFFTKQAQTTQQNQTNIITLDELKNANLSYMLDEDKTIDNFKLTDGEAKIGIGSNNPRVYNFAVATIGDLNDDKISEGVIGLYRSWGANRILPIIFVLEKQNGVLSQATYVIPDQSNYNYETAIKSLSIDNGVLSVNLLVLSDADKNLPHYQQTPTIGKTVQYKLTNGKLVLQPADQTASTTEKATGIIKSVYSNSGKNYLSIDYVTMNPNWKPGGTNGSAYTNDNTQIRAFELSPDVEFIIDGPDGTPVTFSQFQNFFSTSYENGIKVFNSYRASNPWDIEITNSMITKVTEYYIP